MFVLRKFKFVFLYSVFQALENSYSIKKIDSGAEAAETGALEP